MANAPAPAAEDLGHLDREKSGKLQQHTTEVGEILHRLLPIGAKRNARI